jgi:hypothetical protein
MKGESMASAYNYRGWIIKFVPCSKGKGNYYTARWHNVELIAYGAIKIEKAVDKYLTEHSKKS